MLCKLPSSLYCYCNCAECGKCEFNLAARELYVYIFDNNVVGVVEGVHIVKLGGGEDAGSSLGIAVANQIKLTFNSLVMSNVAYCCCNTSVFCLCFLDIYCI